MNRFDTLFYKFINKVATEEEEQELFNMIRKPDDDENLRALIDEVMQQHMGERTMNNHSAEKVLSVILATTRSQKRVVRMDIRKWAVAAALLAVAGCIAAWLLHTRSTNASAASTVAASTLPQVDPAKQGALLTLEDGSTVSLDSLHSRPIEPQGGTRVSVKNNQISYDDRNAKQVAWNTLSTPRGRIFHLVLPDGSRVWLNAESAIRYPTSFEGKERKVELSGEAFFEIAKNEKMPFKVSIDPKTELEVLGTSFNINAYKNEEAMRATLLSGSVRMNAAQAPGTVLRPGEQAVVAQSGIKVLQADTAKVMAWRHGIFNFENADIKIVMRQLERWYNIDVEYENSIPEITFGGKMGRDLSLQNVLRILEISKVHFRLASNNKLIVTP
ncbi:MAG: FecR domain-containing protein [Chitinophagaceae bacterium]|nr:FecR domain-containing protein [Chitinophagaceae bacterium]